MTETSFLSQTWLAILKEARDEQHKHKELQNDDASKEFLVLFQPCFPAWKSQLIGYVAEFSKPKNESQKLSDLQKQLILETRAALRFGLCCFSFDDKQVAKEIQNLAVLECQWHLVIFSLLSQRRGDSKCRVLTAQLLNNLVASNPETATEIASTLPISPSQERVSSAILQDLSQEIEDGVSNIIEPNWTDMIISAAKAGNREAIGAIVAALYNSLVSCKGAGAFTREIATSNILMSTLLRQFVSVDAIQSVLIEKSDSDERDQDHWDSATDWIYLLLTKLSQLGMLPAMYTAITNSDRTNEGQTTVLPEHNVLLHCMVREAESFVAADAKDPNIADPFGGEAGWDAIVESYDFLVELLNKLRLSSIYEDHSTADNTDRELIQSAIYSVVDILATTLGVDNSPITRLREHLGTSSTLLQESAKVLGAIVDDLAVRSFGRKSRELKLSNDEQRRITGLVRLLGNLCFQCRTNQDLMRTTLVPSTNSTTPNGDCADPSRNALHVLLSCTSFATACFTLREWGVIAIRNVLELNSANQDVVAALDAQDAVQSADLQQAGVRVEMNQRGQVSLSTLDEKDEGKGGTSNNNAS